MDHNSIRNAADALHREADRQRSLAEAAKTLGDVATLFARVQEAEKTLAKSIEDNKAALLSLDAAVLDAQKARDEALNVRNETLACAEADRNTSKEAAQKAIDDAAETGRKMIENAQAQCDDMISGAKAKMIEATADVDNAIAEKKAELAGIEESLAVKAPQLEELEIKLAKAKQAAAAMLAGD